MITVKHQLEAKKFTISEELTENTEVQVILIEADLLNERTEALTEQTNKLIVTSEMNPDIGPIV